MNNPYEVQCFLAENIEEKDTAFVLNLNKNMKKLTKRIVKLMNMMRNI